MSSDSKNGGGAYTSTFDELLERNRKEFDALYAKSGAAPIERLLETRTPPSTGISLNRPSTSSPSPLSRHSRDPVEAPLSSATARSLRTRIGDDWTFNVTERHRDGDQAIVLGKLTVKSKEVGKDIVKAQFGHATIKGAGAPSSSSPALAGAPSSSSILDRAYDEAAEAALARCAALL